MPLNNQAAYVGQSAFAHKAGYHVAAIVKDADTYQHIKPELVGNGRRVLVSELSGISDSVIEAIQLRISAAFHSGYRYPWIFMVSWKKTEHLPSARLGRHGGLGARTTFHMLQSQD